QREFINTVIRLCREIAGDRPVLPYVWHRRPPSSRKLRYEPPHLSLLPDEEIRRSVRWALDAGADGIVWWGGDNFEIEMIQGPPPSEGSGRQRYLRLKSVYAEEKPRGMSYEAYLDSLHRRILRMLGEEISRYE
ncbi:MAG: hypothetical protein JSV91_03760, partial [Phycisphaerales bacterium]